MFSTRILTQFVAVAEELHFGRAAARVHMAQSPLSQAILRLEQNMGVTLLSRTRRSVALTPAGEVFLKSARDMLRTEDATVAIVRHAQQFGSGSLSIGFVGNVAYRIVPQLLHGFREAHPTIHLDIAEMLTRDQIRDVVAGRLDVGIVRLPLTDTAGVDVRVTQRDHYVLALPLNHPLTRLKTVPLRQLRVEPFVAYSNDRVPVLHSAGVALCLDEGFYPNIVCQAWQASSILSFVAAGVGVALVPSHLTIFSHPDVTYRPLTLLQGDTSLSIAVISRRGNRSEALQAFLQTVPEVGATAASPRSKSRGHR